MGGRGSLRFSYHGNSREQFPSPKLCLIEIWVCMEEEGTVERKERKRGECYHGERNAEAYIKEVNQSRGLAPDRSVGLEPRKTGHAHVSL